MVSFQISTLNFLFISGFLCGFISGHAFALPEWVTPPGQSFLIAQGKLQKKKGDYFKRTVKRAGNQQIELEGVASISGNLDHFYQIAQDTPHYRNWALSQINTRPNGKSYLIKILDLRPSSHSKEILTAVFGLEFPFMKTKIEKDFRIQSEKDSRSSTVYCQNLNPPDTILSSLRGFITAFNHPKEANRLWVYFKGNTQLTHWLLYQAIPERVLAGESSERIYTVLDNFSSEEVKYPLNRIKSPQKKR